MSAKPLSAVEGIKARSRGLRGTLAEGLANPVTGAIDDDDTQLIKFHGSYQQDDRDLREERRQQKLEPAYSFMIRTRTPGGVCAPAQWLAFDEIARTWANGTLRITTRQAFQFHGVVKSHLKETMQAIHRTLTDTIAACGDVNRNVIATATPVQSAAHEEVYRWAVRLSEHLLPRTRAYHEIFLDGEKLEGTPEVEPVLGQTYLPRKFKTAIAIPPQNDVDLFAQDLGFTAILEEGRLVGFNVSVGGGMGSTHGEAETYPRLADVIGFVTPGQVLATAEAVVTTQRDFGDRTNRKHARLKYTIDERGLEWFVGEVERRLGFRLPPARPYEFKATGDRFGWLEGHDGRWHLTLRIEAGRIADRGEEQHLSGLREIARVHQGDFRLTPNQNLVVANVPSGQRARVTALAAQYGLLAPSQRAPVRRDALACVALPTCALAMAEAERYLPAFATRVEELMGRHGLGGEPLQLRITGCPNGCARPFLAEVALVGKAPGRYNLYLGGSHEGSRLNALYRENIDETTILAELDGVFARYAAERLAGERLGAFAWRAGLVQVPKRAAAAVPGGEA